MSHYLDHPEVFDLPIRLSAEEKQNPYGVLKQFCHDYHLHELRSYQWDQLAVCLTTDNAHFSEPEQRADLVYRHEQMEKLFEAVFLIFSSSSKTHHKTGTQPGTAY